MLIKTIITGRFTCRSSEEDTDLEVLDNTGCMIQEFMRVNTAQRINVVICQSIPTDSFAVYTFASLRTAKK